MPRVSVVITTHNRVRLLKRAIQSAKVAGKDIEVIVVDDASTDGTEEYCRSVNGIQYIKLSTNQKTAAARNAGLETASAPFVVFLDDDDWRLPNSLAHQLAIIENDPKCGFIYGQSLLASPAGEILDRGPFPEVCREGDLFKDLLEMNPFAPAAAVVRREAFDKVGGFDVSDAMWGIEDWDMWLRIAEHFRVRAVSEPVAVYRMPSYDTGQWSSNVQKQFGRVATAYKNKWFRLPRARKLLAEKKIDRRKLLKSVADRILFDMATVPGSTRTKVSKIITSLKCRPSGILDLNFYKTVARSFGVDRRP